MFSRRMSVLATIASLAIGTYAHAAVIATWTFETSIPTTAGPLTPEVGAGSGTALHASGATIYSNPAGNGSAESWSSDKWAVGDYYQFQVATNGPTTFQNIMVSWDQTGSGTGPRDFGIFYSTDGTNFTQFGSDYTVLLNGAPNSAWSVGAGVQAAYHYTRDLSGITGLNNQAAIYIRLATRSTTSINGGTVATAGTGRIDNVTIEATPEPTTLALLGLGALAAFRRRRSAR